MFLNRNVSSKSFGDSVIWPLEGIIAALTKRVGPTPLSLARGHTHKRAHTHARTRARTPSLTTKMQPKEGTNTVSLFVSIR